MQATRARPCPLCFGLLVAALTGCAGSHTSTTPRHSAGHASVAPGEVGALDAFAAAAQREVELVPLDADARIAAPTVSALCAARVSRHQAGDEDSGEEHGGDEDGVDEDGVDADGRGDDGVDDDACRFEPVQSPTEDFPYELGTLVVRLPNFDGVLEEVWLVARDADTSYGLMKLGVHHGDSRMSNAYAALESVEALGPEAPVTRLVRYAAGHGYADGCNGFHLEADDFLALCGRDSDGPRCFAGARLGPVDYAADDLLATVAESLGQCDDVPTTTPPRSPRDLEPTYDAEVVGGDLRFTRRRPTPSGEPDARGARCIPLRAAVRTLPSAPAQACADPR